MANGQKKQSSGFSIEYLCCCGCIIGGIFLVFMMINFISGSGFEGGKNDESLQETNYSSVDDCLEKLYGSKGISGNCSYNGPNINNSASRNNVDTVVRYLSGKGFNKTAIAGIIGNWVQESSVDPSNCQNDCQDSSGGDTAECALAKYYCGYGLAQWTYPSRKQNLVDFATKNNKSAADMQLQLDFFMWELENSHPSLQANLNKSKDISEATLTFHNVFEGSADNAEMLQTRIRFANDAYKGITCTSSSTALDALVTNSNKVQISGVPYYNQQDYPNTKINEFEGQPSIAQSGCGITSAAMISNYVNKTKNKSTYTELKPDKYYTKYGAQHLTSLQNSTGLKALTDGSAWNFSTNQKDSWDKIKNQINRGNPVMIFTGYSGSHIIVITGYTLDSTGNIKEVIVNDPYNNYYQPVQQKAENVSYPFADFNQHLTTYHHEEFSKVYYLDYSNPSAVNAVDQYTDEQRQKCKEIIANQNANSQSSGQLNSDCVVSGITFDNGTYDHIYLHWSGGNYQNNPADGYHITIDDKGNIYQNHPFSEVTKHTEKRNTNAIAIALLGMDGYKNTTDWQNSYGATYPITDIQIETMAKVVATIANHYNIPIDSTHVMTHAEAAALKDFSIDNVKKVSAANIKCTGCEAYCDYQANQLDMPHTNYGPADWGDGWPAGTSCRWDLKDHGDIIRNKASQCIAINASSSNKCWPIPDVNKEQYSQTYPTSDFKDCRCSADKSYSGCCDRLHMGNDILIPKDGKSHNILAIESGTVTQIFDKFYKCNGYDIDYVLIKNDSGSYNGYGELDQGSEKIKTGDHVQAGQTIGTVSYNGCGMLHFEKPKSSPRPDSYNYDQFEDPRPYLDQTSDNCS